MKQRLCACGCGGTPKPGNRFINGHSKGHAGKSHTKETKKKQRETRLKRKKELGYLNSTETREKQRVARLGEKVSQETREKMVIASKEVWKDKEYRKKQTKSHIEAWQDLDLREQRSKSQSDLWKDKKYKDSQIKAIMGGSNKKPNECEKLLFNIVDKLFPGMYKLNVKGEYARPAGKLPDIVNIKEKKLIEHCGDYWHANEEYCKRTGLKFVEDIPVEIVRRKDKERLDSIESLGWRVLIVWEHELKDIDSLEKKITKFVDLKGIKIR